MNSQIDPLILQKLQAFSARRRKLIVRRGIFAAIATLLATMMLVAVVDWIFVLPDLWRWVLSVTAYLSIIVVEWRSCWRLLVHSPDPRQLARLIEHAEPKLREDLLSAVELGDVNSGHGFDSEQFRALLQSDVSSRMESLDMDRLLPTQLVRRTAWIAAGIGAACLVALALTGFQFGTLMMRALLPMANFARVSAVKVQIVEPAPAEMRVPQGDTLPLIVELSGRRATKATLETFTPSGGREVLTMTPIGRDRFSATIQVGRENVQYRVRAGDALTKKYQLEAVARPAVVEFQKSYTFPAYAQLPPKAVTEENGDLAAIEGSTVELHLKTNQKVKDAELRIEQGKKTVTVPLVAQGDMLIAQVPMTTSGVYRVHLVGAESGFENKFSPEYELRASPDLVPQVELETPKQDLILPSNEIVDVQGTASDDLALAKVAQLVKINEGPWKETVLPGGTGLQAKVERRWDLFEQGVKPGDLVTMKLVATDLHGNKAESRPLQISITAAGFETKRLQTLIDQRQILGALTALQTSSAVLTKRAVELKQLFDRTGDDDPQRRPAVPPMSAALADTLQKSGDVMNAVTTAMKEVVPGHQTGDLTLIGRTVVRGAGFLQTAGRLHEVVSSNPAMQGAKELLNEAQDMAQKTESRARQTLEFFRYFLSAEEIDVFNENLQVVAAEQDRLVGLAHRAGTDPEKWTPVANRLRVVLAEMRGLEDLASVTAEHGPGWVPERMRNLLKLINKRRTTLETALAGKPGVELLGPTLEMGKAVEEATRSAFDMRRDFRTPPVDRLREIVREVEPSYSSFEYLRGDLDRLIRRDRIPTEAADLLIDGRWGARIELFKSRGDIEEWRPDADTQFVADLRLTTRVLQAMRDKLAGAKPDVKEMQAIDRQFRVLEYGHEIAEAVGVLTTLSAAERWEVQNPKARTTNPRDWDWVKERLRSIPDEMGRALNFEERRSLSNDAQKILREAFNQPFTQGLQREMDERLNIPRPPVTMRNQTEELTAYVRRALELFRQPMEEARKQLEQQTPTLADTMKQLAKKADELKGQTQNQAQQAHEKLPEEAKADARDTLAQQQKLNERIEALKDALRAEANKQDIMKADGREKARDADDALAMLKEPPVKAQENLELAAKSERTALQEQALNQAAEQQQKLAAALDQLAEHYDAVEKGKAEDTRMALRETETANGIKEQLDQQFAKAEELAKLSQATPEELLAQLEKALPKNPQMQQELSAISQSTLKTAADQLKQASAQENAVAQNVQKMAAEQQAAKPPGTNPNAPQPPAAQNPTANAPAPNAPDSPPAAQPPNANQPTPNNPAANAQSQSAMAQTPQPNTPPQNPNGQRPGAPPSTPEATQPKSGDSPAAPQTNPMLAQAAQQQAPIGASAKQAAEDIARAGRHEERMQNKVAGEQLQKLGNQLQATAQEQVPSAQQALEKAQMAADAQAAVEAANAGLQKALGQLNATTNPGEAQEQAAAQPSPAGQSPMPAGPTPAGQNPAAQPAAMAGSQPPPTPPSAAQPANSATAPQMAQNASPAEAAGKPDGRTEAAPAQSSAPTKSSPGKGENAPGAQTAQTGKPNIPTTPTDPGSPASPSAAQPREMPANAPGMTGEPKTIAEMAASTASPQEQVWMARALDALDAALHSQPGSDGQQQGQQAAQAAQQGQAQAAQQAANQQPSAAQAAAQQQAASGQAAQQQQQGSPAAQAQSALASAAQAAAAAARANRSEASQPANEGQPGQNGTANVAKNGSQSAPPGPRGALAEAKNKPGDWGKLPKQMAEQLTQGQREGVAGEYRNQVETYYRVIAEKSKKQ